MKLPEGGSLILNARIKGMTPADPVVISFMSERLDCEPVVYAEASGRYDWRFLKDLSCYVFMPSDMPNKLTHLNAMGPILKSPIEVFYPDLSDGQTYYWSPNLESVEEVIAGKRKHANIIYELEPWVWLDYMKREFTAFYKEAARAAHRRFN